ncbi:MAG: hypothetical protein ACT4TC_07725 [Myxococcaceae bacterium]
MTSSLARALAVSGALFVLASCRDEGVTSSGCRQDSDCGSPTAAHRCEASTGVCYCRTNDACRSSEFCNPSGFCQDRAGCEKNADCNSDSLFCDTTTGTCLAKGRCTLDLHCNLGQICDVAKSTCVAGCRTNGDCPSSSCRCGDKACVCNGTTPAEIAQCAVGVCDSNFCANETFCAFGQQCGVIADAGTTLNQCFSDYDPLRKPYCDNCAFGGGLQTCGRGANYCLIDTANRGNYYCGVDCSSGEACPRGYGCQDVIVVLQQTQCSRANPYCAPRANARSCTSNADCKHGGNCVIQAGQTSGLCAGKCAIDEGDDFGYCSCEATEDCVQEACGSDQLCTISKRNCNTNADCRTINCVDYQGAGGCLIGQNCAPNNGLSCLQVK